MKLYALLLFTVSLVSCRSKGRTFPTPDHYSKIASITNESELEFQTKMFNDYSAISDKAQTYAGHFSELEKRAEEFRALLEHREKIPRENQKDFIQSFTNSVDDINVSDSTDLEQLKITPIEYKEDIDHLLLFMARAYLRNLSVEDRYLFNTISSTASVSSYNIKKGEIFSADLNITAANRNKPAEWYILKPGKQEVTQDNVADTLYPDKWGNVNYQTKNYKIGENRIVYAVRIPSIRGDVTLARVIIFNVR